ncbi:MAG: hypothetical protein JNM24_04755 [Bdellovibrionaceae bacterium]|nr:hypothetical protein [Pseudobdellovibrionaceae bacterium]
MKRKILSLILATTLTISPLQSRASIFGEETAVLLQILANAVTQLAQLRSILKEGQDSLNLMRDINRGINDSLAMAETLGIHLDPRLYGELKKYQDIMGKIESVYGAVVDSPLAEVQRNSDQAVVEAVSFNNTVYEYTEKLDQIGEEIKKYSHEVSPGGAAKLTAQSLGVMIHVMNQQLRAQATGLKLQAQTLAAENKKEKDSTAQYLRESNKLKAAMQTENISFQTPRFQ